MSLTGGVLLPGLCMGLIAVEVMVLVRSLPRRFQSVGTAPTLKMVKGVFFFFLFIIAIVVIVQFNTSTKARGSVSDEASSISELYWFAHSMPQPEHGELQGLLRNYASVVAHKEWPLLASGKTSPEASAAIRAIRQNILDFTPTTDFEKTLYPNALSEVSNLFATRRVRNAFAPPGQPVALLYGLLALAVLSVFLYSLVGPLLRARDLVVLGLFAVVAISSVLLALALNKPFTGPVAVTPAAFNALFSGTFVNIT